MKRVLVCEDEDLIRKGICKIVEGVCRDVQVQECDNGLEGYKAIAMWNPHVVITDKMCIRDRKWTDCVHAALYELCK